MDHGFKKSGLIVMSAVLFGAAFNASASNYPKPGFGLAVDGALEFGGDSIGTVSFTDGSTQDINAGQGLGVDIGGYYRFASQPISVRATVGYKYTTTSASNADITLTRVPLELIGTYHFGNGIRLGGGLVHHTSIKFDADGLGPNLKFDDATGFTLEAGWKYFLVGYTFIDYKDEFGNSYDAGNIGIKFIGEFRL